MATQPPFDDNDGFGQAQSLSNGNGEDLGPQVGVISQYIKDLSFENPNAPQVYQWQGQPKIDVQLNINSQKVGDDIYEVAIKVEITAKSDADGTDAPAGGGGTAFAVELVYAGLFALRNIPDDHLQPFLLAEAPRILFPFARRVVADAVQDGGFPPLYLEPIDFAGLYAAQGEQALLGEPAGQA